MARIFISYKRADKDLVFSIKDKIEAATGEECWIDLDGIESDAIFVNVIVRAINAADVFLFMYSKTHAHIIDYENDWTVKEISFAQHKKKRIVFVNIDNSPLEDYFLMQFGAKQQIDATSQEALERLFKDINNWLHNTELSPKKVTSKTSQTIITGDNCIVDLGHATLNMIRVEGGEMLIGATSEQESEADANECPAHSVNIKTFYMSQFQITQNIWEIVMGYNKSAHREKGCPVENLSYDEAQEFVHRLSMMTSIKFSLPTEQEWEYAARGGQKSHQFKYAGSDNLGEVAWYRENSGGETHNVGEKMPNELKLYDMCGNVWEWTETPAQSYGTNIEAGGNVFIRRGGSWWQEAKDCRVSRRYASDRAKRTSGLGLRVVIREGMD